MFYAELVSYLRSIPSIAATLNTFEDEPSIFSNEAPQDAKILELNTKLNKTYLAYGKIGAAKKRDQSVQDTNAAIAPSTGAAVQRAISKGSSNYYNSNWDLVDASNEKNFDITKLSDNDLPKEMQGMNINERKNYISTKAKERETIQTEISGLNKKRIAYVTQKRKEQAEESGKLTLDEVIADTVRAQAEKMGYAFSN
jgi:hypothetical protein